MNVANHLPDSSPRPSHLAVAGRSRHGPQPTVPDGVRTSTVRAVVTEAANEVVAAFCTDQHGETAVVFVAHPTPSGCEGARRCLPLGPALGLDDGLAGHLHRLTDPDEGTADSGTDTGSGPDPDGAGFALSLRATAAVIAAHVGRDLMDVELARARHDAAHLQSALHSNRTIGVALGVLMATCHVDRDQAFDLLRHASQTQNRKIRHVAADVEYTGVIPGEQEAG